MRHWITRYRMSNALDAGTLPALLATGHAARCAACQRFARDLEALHARLLTGAPRAPAPVIARAPARTGRWLAATAGGLALATALAVVLITTRSPPAVDPVTAPAPTPAPAPALDVTAQLSRLVDQSQAPLDRELHDLVEDSRRGLDAVLATGGLRL